MVSILTIGDPHFKIDNMIEVELFIQQIIKIAIDKNPDFIVVLGDLLHTHERLHTIPLNKAHEFILKLRDIAPVYVLIGNHDAINNQIFLTNNHWMNGMKEWKNVTIVDKVISSSIKGFDFLFCPYVHPGRFIDALDTYGKWDDITAIFAHQEFYGCKMGVITSTEGDKWQLQFPLVISGHIHDKQFLQPNIYYTGSSMQHAFGETPNKTIAFIRFDEDGFHTEEIYLNLPKKKIIYISADEVSDYKIPNGIDQLKISVSGTCEEFNAIKKTSNYKKLIQQGIKVVFKPNKTVLEIQDNNPINLCFHTILRNSILDAKDSFLSQAYENIIGPISNNVIFL